MNIAELQTPFKNFFKELKFNEEKHLYSVGGKPLKNSVSNLISAFGNKFDTQKMSQIVADKANIPRENIVSKWDEERENSIVRGNSVHYYAEEYLKNKDLKPITQRQKLVVSFLSSIPEHIVIVDTEIKMYHKKYMFGGTCDLLLYNTLTGKYILADYKTNKDVHKNYKGQTLLKPFNNLLDNPLNKYKLQLSYYQILLEQVEGIKIEERKIIWFTGNTYEIYTVEEYTEKLLIELESNEN